MINAFKAAYNLTDVTVVADAGMVSETTQIALQAAGLSFILGARISFLPDVVRKWRDKHPGQDVPDQLVLTQPWPAGSSEKTAGSPTESPTKRTATTGRGDRCAASMRGLPKPNGSSTDIRWSKRNRFIRLTDATKSINRELETKAHPGRLEGRHRQPGRPAH